MKKIFLIVQEERRALVLKTFNNGRIIMIQLIP